jgi:hypothetical protein
MEPLRFKEVLFGIGERGDLRGVLGLLADSTREPSLIGRDSTFRKIWRFAGI